MTMLAQFVDVTIGFVLIALVGLLLLLILYGVIRLLRLSEQWVIRVIGVLFFVDGCLSVALLLLRSQADERLQVLMMESELLAMASCLAAVYALCQWGSRRWYLLVKKRAAAINTAARNLLLFFRSYHRIFGWLVLLTAVGHAIALLPRLAAYSEQALISGVLALTMLCVLVGLGLWVERAIKQKRLSSKARLFHVVSSAMFFLLLLLHLTMK